MAKKPGIKLIANNKKAFHDYFIEDTYEAGIALAGTEVKSLRMGKCSVKESFVRVEKGEVYIYGMNGRIVELPKGSTVIDYAFNLDSDIGNTMVGAIVNDDYKDVSYVLKNNDRVRIISDELSFGPREEWITKAVTTKARKRIKEFNKEIRK